MRDYKITNADGVEMTVQLDDETAARLGLAVEAKAAAKPRNKARQAPNKAPARPE